MNMRVRDPSRSEENTVTHKWLLSDPAMEAEIEAAEYRRDFDPTESTDRDDERWADGQAANEIYGRD